MKLHTKKKHLLVFLLFQVEPIIQKGNEGFVHHFLLYECDGNFVDKDFDQGVDCYNLANMPYAKCRDASVVAAWAVGGEVSNVSYVRNVAPERDLGRV